MPFKKSNGIVALVIIFSIIFFLALLVFLSAYNVPESLGSPASEYQVKEVYQFEPWSFHLNDMHVNFPEGGLIAHAYQNGNIKGALFWGNATYYHNESYDYALPEDPKGFLLFIEEDILQSQKGEVIFTSVTDTSQEKKMKNIFEKNPGLPVLEGAGVPLSFPPVNDSFYLYFLDEDESFVSPMIYHADTENPWLSGFIYACLFMIFLLVLQLLSLGVGFPKSRTTYPRQPTRVLPAILVILALMCTTYYLVNELGVTSYGNSAGYALGLIIVWVWFRHGKLWKHHLGISKKTWGKGYFLAVITSLLFLLLPFELISGINVDSWGHALLDFLLTFFAFALLHELIWRGFIQASLSRLVGPYGGLLLTAALTGITQYTVIYFSTPETLLYPFTMVDIAVLVPGTALILGFLFQRTENIFSCALLHTLIVFLPGYLVY